jgi:hypothetical protein
MEKTNALIDTNSEGNKPAHRPQLWKYRPVVILQNDFAANFVPSLQDSDQNGKAKVARDGDKNVTWGGIWSR